MELAKFWDDGGLMHCDWKYDQVAVDRSGTMKVVDLKSIKHLEGGPKPYLAGRGCRHSKDCKRCMKMMEFPREHSCDHQTSEWRARRLCPCWPFV